MSATKQWNPGTAAVLSLFFPGAGQIYKGSIGGGILWLICVGVGYALVIFPGVILHIICIYRAYSGNPYIQDSGSEAEYSWITHGKCPECKEIVLKDANICKHCHSPLTPQTIIKLSK